MVVRLLFSRQKIKKRERLGQLVNVRLVGAGRWRGGSQARSFKWGHFLSQSSASSLFIRLRKSVNIHREQEVLDGGRVGVADGGWEPACYDGSVFKSRAVQGAELHHF